MTIRLVNVVVNDINYVAYYCLLMNLLFYCTRKKGTGVLGATSSACLSAHPFWKHITCIWLYLEDAHWVARESVSHSQTVVRYYEKLKLAGWLRIKNCFNCCARWAVLGYFFFLRLLKRTNLSFPADRATGASFKMKRVLFGFFLARKQKQFRNSDQESRWVTAALSSLTLCCFWNSVVIWYFKYLNINILNI